MSKQAEVSLDTQLPAIIETFKAEISKTANLEAAKKFQTDYENLVIAGTGDKDGLKKCKEAVKEAKSYRVAIEKKRKELTAPINRIKREIDNHAREITAPFGAVETILTGRITEIERRAETEKRQEEKRRIDIMVNAGYGFASGWFGLGKLSVSQFDVFAATEEQLQEFANAAVAEKTRIEEQSKADEALRLQAEQARIKAEQEAAELRKKLAELEAQKQELEAKQAPEPTPMPAPDKIAPQNNVSNTSSAAPQPLRSFGTPAAVPQPETPKHFTPTPQAAPSQDYLTHYRTGFEDCRRQILSRLKDPEPLTREGWVQFVNAVRSTL